MTTTWLEPVQADIEQLRLAATALGGATVEERQRAFEAKASEIRGRARNIAARSNQLGKSTAAEMRALASTVAIAPGAAGFSCYDPTLAERLRQAAAQAEQPAELKLREAVFNEGPAGVANAVKNLWRNIGAYTRSLFSLRVHARRHRRRRPHRYRRADHRPRPDRAARHHRHRPGPAGAGDRQPAARAAVHPPVRRADPADRRGRSTRPIARANVDRDWMQRSFHPSQARVLSRHPQSLQLPIPTTSRKRRRALAMNQLAGVLSDLDWCAGPTRPPGAQEERARGAEGRRGARQRHRHLPRSARSGVEEQRADARACWRATTRRPSAITACSPRPSAPWRSPGGARKPARTSRSSPWSRPRA